MDVLGPYLTKVAIDKYLANRTESHSLLDRFLSSQPMTGIAQIAAIYLGLLLISFLFEFTQTYVMQWAGQKVMFDLRAQIFRHLQRLHIAFFDQQSRRPSGYARDQRRGCLERDVHGRRGLDLRRHLRAGGIVVIMLNMSWRLALITFAVLPVIFFATSCFARRCGKATGASASPSRRSMPTCRNT